MKRHLIKQIMQIREIKMFSTSDNSISKSQWIMFLYLLKWLQLKDWKKQMLQGYGAIGTLVHWWMNCKMIQPLWK